MAMISQLLLAGMILLLVQSKALLSLDEESLYKATRDH